MGGNLGFDFGVVVIAIGEDIDGVSKHDRSRASYIIYVYRPRVYCNDAVTLTLLR